MTCNTYKNGILHSTSYKVIHYILGKYHLSWLIRLELGISFISNIIHTAFFSAELLPRDEAICSAVISLEIKIALHNTIHTE
jgi:hypothetical protein